MFYLGGGYPGLYGSSLLTRELELPPSTELEVTIPMVMLIASTTRAVVITRGTATSPMRILRRADLPMRQVASRSGDVEIPMRVTRQATLRRR